ncbi:MAG TPA: DUF1996 domain-containing protein [Streptosporangiaceae bacterium]|nr:DUF1996 domain-containing protein [Streptosporangiaceae bacterium]
MLLILAAAVFGLPYSRSAQAANDDGINFRMECDVDHFGANDPIVSPNLPGNSHMHSFYSNSSTNAASTTASLLAHTGSCSYTGDFDRSAYWIPSLLQGGKVYREGSQQLVVYYRRAGGATGPTVHAFPAGLRMIAGDSGATSPQSQSVTFWDCGAGGPRYAVIPDCTNASSGDTPRAVINFPSCWDGVHLDSADHKSHMSYPNSNTGACPAGHPVSVPKIAFESWYNGIHGGSSFSLSTGSNYSMHGDFFAAWDPRLQNGLIDNCLNTHRRSCSAVQVWPSNDVAPNHTGDVTSDGEYLFNINNPKYAAAARPATAKSAPAAAPAAALGPATARPAPAVTPSPSPSPVPSRSGDVFAAEPDSASNKPDTASNKPAATHLSELVMLSLGALAAMGWVLYRRRKLRRKRRALI